MGDLRLKDLHEYAGFEHVDEQAYGARLQAQLATRVRRPADAPLWAVHARPEGVDVIARSALVGRLRDADLRELASRVATTRRAGRIVIFFESDEGCALDWIPLERRADTEVST